MVNIAPSKTFDVSPPGSSQATASGRPVVAGNKTEVSDPTIVSRGRQGINIKPPSESESNAQEDQDTPPISNETAETSAIADSVVQKKKRSPEDESESREKYQKLIDDKTYFLNIKESAASGTGVKILIILLFLVLVGMVAVNFLIDAGVIDLGITPLTNLL